MTRPNSIQATIVVVLIAAPSWAHAQLATTPPELDGVGIHEHLNALMPRDVPMRDHTGRAVMFGDYFAGGRPALLVFVYHSCPMQCSLVLQGVVNSLRTIEWTVGRQFDAIVVSIDPRDTPSVAMERRTRSVGNYSREGSEPGWHFLVGTEPNIHRLTDAIGFNYRWFAPEQQYLHAAAIYLLTPTGRIARYLYGAGFDGRDLRLGLLEASEGRSISTVERFILFCYHYDPNGRRYVLFARRVMQIGGGLTVIALGGLLATLWLRDRRRASRAAAHTPTQPLEPAGVAPSEAVSR